CFFFLMIRRPPRSTLFPTRRSSDLLYILRSSATRAFGSSFCHSSTAAPKPDRKSTRLNSSHTEISYAVFCLKKKNSSLVMVESTEGLFLLVRGALAYELA